MPSLTARFLDRQRLGKQRVEALQIMQVLLGLQESKGWKHHPAVLMWKGYEPYLLKVYIRAMLDEWAIRGYKNTKSEEKYQQYLDYIEGRDVVKPPWITEQFCKSHRSNLLRKDYDYYKKYFNEPNNLPYVWPVTKETINVN